MNNLGTKLFILSFEVRTNERQVPITYSVCQGNIYIWHPKYINIMENCKMYRITNSIPKELLDLYLVNYNNKKNRHLVMLGNFFFYRKKNPLRKKLECKNQ